MTDIFRPNLQTTGVGSLPWTDAQGAAAFVLQAGLSIPFWPQLPKRCFLEQMIPQFSESMPCVRTENADGGRIFLAQVGAAEKYKELERFYEAYLGSPPRFTAAGGPLSEELDGFLPGVVSEQAAAGLYAFERLAAGRTWPVVKGQVTGPITFCTGIADADKKPLYADAELREAAVKLLARKAQWQVRRLAPLADERVLIFVDEPVLAAYGSSAYLGITEDDVWRMEGEVFEAIAQAGAMGGMHVCGNSDWSVVIRTGVGVLNFDAYQYGTTVALYPEAVGELFDRGGCIAWGIVPTLHARGRETVDSLARRFEECLAALAAKGFSMDLLRERSLLTPSCGTGSLPNGDDAAKVFDLLRALRHKLGG